MKFAVQTFNRQLYKNQAYANLKKYECSFFKQVLSTPWSEISMISNEMDRNRVRVVSFMSNLLAELLQMCSDRNFYGMIDPMHRLVLISKNLVDSKPTLYLY